jgi:hypothetical protein
LLSAGPLFLTGDSKRRFHFKFRNFRLFFRKRVHLYIFAEGIQFLIEIIIWPVFVFLLFRDIMVIGILATISSIAIIMFTFIFGKLANRGANKTRIMRVGGIFYGLVLISMAFVSNVNEVYIISFLSGLFSTLIVISVHAKFCDEARQGNIMAANITRHIWLGLGRIIPIFLLFYFLGFQVSLIICGISVMALLLI